MLKIAAIVPHSDILIVHAPLGEVEWPDTIEHIENTIPAGITFELAPVASGKSLLERIEERGQFPIRRAAGAPPTSNVARLKRLSATT